MYYIGNSNDKTMFILYIDNLFITRVDESQIAWLKTKLCDITSLGQVKHYLGVELTISFVDIFLSQHQYVLNMLQDFDMLNCKIEHVPLSFGLGLISDMESPPTNLHQFCRIVGKLIFLTTTRPNLSYSMSSVSRFISQPSYVTSEKLNTY